MVSPAVEILVPHVPSLLLHPPDQLAAVPSYLARLAATHAPTLTFVLEADLAEQQDLSQLVPDGFLVLRQSESSRIRQVLAEAPGACLLLTSVGSTCGAAVLTDNEHEARRVLAEVEARQVLRESPDVRAFFWSSSRGGPSCSLRTLEVEPAESVLLNYPAAVRHELRRLGEWSEPPKGSGRLLLWHGPPGTGKTNAVLSLLHSWRGWCEADVINDPDALFADPAYLLSVQARPVMRDRWKVLVCEDADEYLRNDARARSGAALGRLLNVTDGLLGRGSKVLVLLTTNDEIARLHPAVTRPGRCLSALEFPRFSAEEASLWLGRTMSSPMSLAELYAARDGRGSTATPQPAIGAYL